MVTAKPIPTKLTSKDMTGLLRNHYLPENLPPAGILATEIGSPDGRRFADAIWQSTTRSGGLNLVGHEIKVSRADIMVELADLSKAEPWMQYCDQWWLTISDPKLIEGLDIPEAWGVMSPPSGRRKRSMTVLKDAPLLKPLAKEAGLLRLLTWLSHQSRKDQFGLVQENGSLKRQVEYLEAQVKSHSGSRPNTIHEQQLARIFAKVSEKVEEQRVYLHLGDEEMDSIVDAILDIKKSREENLRIRNSTIGILRHLNHINQNVENLQEYVKKSDLSDEIKQFNNHSF